MDKIEEIVLKMLEKIKLKKISDFYRNHIEVMRYLIFGVLTTVLNIIIYAICFYVINIENLVSNIIAWVLSVIFAYTTNRKYVFNSKANKSKEVIREVISFFTSRLLTLGIDELIMFISVDKLMINGLVMKIISNIIVIILNFIFSKLIVFKKK